MAVCIGGGAYLCLCARAYMRLYLCLGVYVCACLSGIKGKEQ